MRSISERDLSVVIPLLAKKIHEMTGELRAMDERDEELTEEQIEERCDLQESLAQYHDILDSLRVEYESALAEGINLPTYDQLTARFGVTRAE